MAQSTSGLLMILIVALLAFGLAWLSQRKPDVVNLEGAPDEIETWGDAAATLAAAVNMADQLVAAAEQLWRTGRIDKSGRYSWVYRQLTDAFPDLDLDLIDGLIEGAVYWLKVQAGPESGADVVGGERVPTTSSGHVGFSPDKIDYGGM